MPRSLTADAGFQRDVLASVEHAVRLAERDALVLLLWRFDMLLEGVARRAVGRIREAQFAAGRQAPAWMTLRPVEQERRPYALATRALWSLAEAATHPTESRARHMLVDARRALGAWEALPDPAR